MTTARAHRAPDIDQHTMAGAGLRTFIAIAGRWSLSVSDAMALLGVASRSTYHELMRRAKSGGPVRGLAPDQLARLAYILNIYKSLRILFPNHAPSRDTWVRQPNTAPVFGGAPPLELMRTSLIGIYRTNAYLDAARG
jgi:hypothetical protein